MRWAGWCVVGLVVACGNSHADFQRAPDRGGADVEAGSPSSSEVSDAGNDGAAGTTPATQGETGGGGIAGGGGGGAARNGGSASAGLAGKSNGGAANGGKTGGRETNDGGAQAAAGATSAGAAGAPTNDCRAYLACGCGCCSETDVSHACYYPDLGDTFAGVMAKDDAQATDESCASAGCARGTEYACCVVPSDAGEATYRVDAYRSDVERLTLFRADPEDHCTTLTLSSSRDVPLYPIEVPEGWKVEVASSGFDCAEAYNFPSVRYAIGGEGRVAFSTPDRCAIDFDVTLFFYLGIGAEIQATRLVGMGVPVPRIGTGCE